MDLLEQILVRKRVEVSRRGRRAHLFEKLSQEVTVPFAEDDVCHALRRKGNQVSIISEVKFRSPSAGEIHANTVGSAAAIGASFAANGAAAVSVLADGPGFGGSVLTVRRVTLAQSAVPVLFKEFVLAPVQLHVARCAGASMVLLLVRALSPAELHMLIETCRELGLTPLVEAADEEELTIALSTSARVIGINARDLRSFRVDLDLAQRRLQAMPKGRIAVLMSGMRRKEHIQGLDGRTDAVLIGEGLMNTSNPAARLAEFCRP